MSLTSFFPKRRSPCCASNASETHKCEWIFISSCTFITTLLNLLSSILSLLLCKPSFDCLSQGESDSLHRHRNGVRAGLWDAGPGRAGERVHSVHPYVKHHELFRRSLVVMIVCRVMLVYYTVIWIHKHVNEAFSGSDIRRFKYKYFILSVSEFHLLWIKINMTCLFCFTLSGLNNTKEGENITYSE